MFPLILIPIVFGLATGTAIERHYCETDGHATKVSPKQSTSRPRRVAAANV